MSTSSISGSRVVIETIEEPRSSASSFSVTRPSSGPLGNGKLGFSNVAPYIAAAAIAASPVLVGPTVVRTFDASAGAHVTQLFHWDAVSVDEGTMDTVEFSPAAAADLNELFAMSAVIEGERFNLLDA